jgi:hypothetical protein
VGAYHPVVTDYDAKTTGEDDESGEDGVTGEGVDDDTATLDEVEPPPAGTRDVPPQAG